MAKSDVGSSKGGGCCASSVVAEKGLLEPFLGALVDFAGSGSDFFRATFLGFVLPETVPVDPA